MNLLNLIRDKHTLVYKFGLYFVCVAGVAFLLPSGNNLVYSAVKGLKTWPYPDLIANEDVFIPKSDSAFKRQKSQLEETAPVYFTANNAEKEKNLQALKQLMRSQPGNHHLKTAYLLLDTVYKAGVVEKTEILPSKRPVYVVSDGVAEQHNYYGFFTIDKCVDFFETSLKQSSGSEETMAYCIEYLDINLFYDKVLTEKNLNATLNSLPAYSAYFKKGEALIKTNEIITSEKKELIKAYFDIQVPASLLPLNIYGRLIFSFTILAILMFYLYYFRKAVFGRNSHVTFIFLMVLITVFIASKLSPYGILIFNAIPFALLPILIRIFFDSRTALFTFLITVLLCSFYAHDKSQFITIQLITGMGTVFSVAQMQKRSRLVIAAFVVFVFYVLGFVSVNMINGNMIVLTQKIHYLPYVLSALFILTAYPVIYLSEKMFGFVSDFTLIELCDLNTPLLRELSQKVPGTFQHSLQVANLAEEAIFHIGGNTLLVRAGAMYHDIGKMDNPRYFTENQVGEINPHNEILPEESAKIIISHVIKGVEKAKAHKVPEQIIDFIRTHHGTTTAGFFLNNFKKEHINEVIDEGAFRYPGPIPFSKETAVLMMADAVEAASRSLNKYDAVLINDLVDRIIDYKIKENQFVNSDITFKDITIVKKIFKKRLMNMYHVRIEYPR